VVQRHGGELDVVSELGKGAAFRLIFPATRVRSGPSTPAAQSDAEAGTEEASGRAR